MKATTQFQSTEHTGPRGCRNIDHKDQTARQRLKILGRRKKLLARDRKGANRLEQTGDIETQKRSARKGLGNLRTRSKPLERNQGFLKQGANRPKEISEFKTEPTEFKNEEQADRKRTGERKNTGASRSKENREFQNKEETARKRLVRLEKLKTRSKPLERN